MKKMFFGLLAIVIAAASVAFTNHHKFDDCSSSVYWFHVKSTISEPCSSVVNTDFDMLPTADGANDTDPSNNITASTNNPFSCPNTGSNACALGYATTATNFEVVNIGSQLHPDYRWRPKSTTSYTCCVNRP